MNWVEIDLLTKGRRLETARPLPPGDCYAFVCRVDRRRAGDHMPPADVYAWSLRDKLPTIPIPLRAPDPDVPLDLAAAFATTYERGRYARVLRYDRPPEVAVDEATAQWLAERAAAGLR